MLIEIRLSDAGEEAGEDTDLDALRSLYLWLLEDRAVSQHAQVSLASGPARPGAQGGGAFEWVQLAADSGLQIGALALSYAGWRNTRPGRSAGTTATLTRGGTTVELSSDDPEAVARLVAALDDEDSSDS
ncbi:effector-associated constant component EACC1 [Streptomyces sp. cmx-18-6]|uniref:effector-associated constant component EACC1 n=1 Tax=Streptomyces sp. cmx-18-6 TaxID=2790930 RepID=UPI0039802D3D